MYLNNRYHDPTLGQLISVDPLVLQTGEAYIYGSANPITYSDPTGLFSACEFDDDGELVCANDPEHVEYHGVQFGRATPRFWEAFAQQYRRTELDGTSGPLEVRDDPDVELGFYWGHLAALEAKGLSPEISQPGDGEVLGPLAIVAGGVAAACGVAIVGTRGRASGFAGPCLEWAGKTALAAEALDVADSLLDGEEGAGCKVAVAAVGAMLPGYIDEFAVETAGFEVVNYFFGYTSEAC